MKKLPLFIFLIAIFGISIFGQTPAPSPGTVEAEKIRADRAESRYNNFANYNRYKDANTKTRRADER